jgi:TPR repeat protein
VFAIALSPARAAEDWPSARQAADEAYAAQHFAVALADYERLAAQGDALAAERAGHMRLLGSSLYGKPVPRDLGRARQWLAQAARSGSASAALLLQRAESITEGDATGSAEEPDVPGPYGC